MGSIRYTVNQAGMKRLLEDRNGPVVLHIANVGREVAGAYRNCVPVVSGDLKGSIDSKLEPASRGWKAVISSTLLYATWIEDGKRFDPRSGRIIFVKVGPRPCLKNALALIGLGRSRRG